MQRARGFKLRRPENTAAEALATKSGHRKVSGIKTFLDAEHALQI